MIKPAEKFRFGEWLPDLPDLDNPGLTEASNVLWSGGSYIPYNPLTVSGFRVPGGIPLAALRASISQNTLLFVASTDGVSKNYISAAPVNSFNFVDLTPSTGLAYAPYGTLAQFGSTVFYSDGINNPQYNALDLTRQFSKLTGPQGDAPLGQSVGVIGQFLVIGNLFQSGSAFGLQWSSINQPFNWPTPGSANAIASQSGVQYLDAGLSTVYGIAQGDQWGLVVLSNGLERVQYVGGDVVFQFNEIYRGPTAVGPHSWIKFGGRVYCCGGDGFLVTDGVSVQRIGNAKVDRWFQKNWSASFFNVAAGADSQKKLIYWTFPLAGTGIVPNAWIAYNYAEDKWTHGTDGIGCFVTAQEIWEYVPGYGMQVFSSAAAPGGGGFGGTLTGTPITGVIATAETELNAGGRALLQGFRPQVAGLSGGIMTVRIGARARLSDQVIYTPQLPVNGQTNFADALVDANYHRAEVTLNGNFTQAIGGEFKGEPSGQW